MNLKKMWKRFWTLNVHNHEGFTLVELIIVIAILAILSSVAVVGYSSYVKKANAQADKTLVAEIKNSMLLAFYGDQLHKGAYIVLSANGAEVKGDGADELAAVMAAAYGSNWASVLKLKDTGYVGTSTAGYSDTSYKGNEDSLLGEVDKLTGALSDVVKGGFDLGDGEFTEMLEGYGYDKNSGEAVGNVAALYVAQKTKGQTEKIEKAFKNNFSSTTMATQDSAVTAVMKTFNELSAEIGDAAALAAIYAYAEGYAQYYDSLGINNTYESGSAVTEFHKKTVFVNTNNVDEAVNVIVYAGFGTLYTHFGNNNGNETNPEPLNAYVDPDTGMGMTNLRAYVSMMGTVDDNKEAIEGNLGSADCFTDGTVGKMLNTYAALSALNVSTADGQVAVAIAIANGEALLYVLPLNMD